MILLIRTVDFVLSVVMHKAGEFKNNYRKQKSLFDRVLGVPRLAPVGRLLEQKAIGAILRICGGFVFNVGHGTCLPVAAQQLYDAITVFATELSVVVDQRIGDRLNDAYGGWTAFKASRKK